ncbi:DMT family transporter [Pseudorhodoferax sp.]|uniref:DMT family transporter n=1 Tax=Pseudorhodoferax sp. TaxID=1993553 RepID=UPI002DD6AB4A|nr:EamA family transporter [Pseudorhodoferax sp.]
MNPTSSLTPRPAHGVLMVLLAALAWGTTGTAQSFAPSTLSPVWLGALRLLVSAVFFALLLLFTRRFLRWPRLGLPFLALAFVAGLAMAGYNLAFFAGVRASGVAVGTAVALGSGPIWAGLLQALGGHKPSARWWAGSLLAVAGGALMVGSGGSQAVPLSATGLGLCLLAGLSYAVYALVNKRLVAAAAPALVTFVVFTLAALIAVPAAALLAGPAVLGERDLLIAGYLGVVATGVAYLLFSHALRHISAATGVTLALAEPVTAFVLAVLVVGERPGWAAAAGGLLVLAGLVLVVLAELRRPAATSAAVTSAAGSKRSSRTLPSQNG